MTLPILIHQCKIARKGLRWYDYKKITDKLIVLFLQFPMGGLIGFGLSFSFFLVLHMVLGALSISFFLGQIVAFCIAAGMFGLLDYLLMKKVKRAISEHIKEKEPTTP